MKTSELIGAALDWAVAKCEGKTVTYYGRGLWYGIEGGHDYRWEWSPSTNWAHGGPIIERERLAVTCTPSNWCAYAHDGTSEVPNVGSVYKWKHKQVGPTPLVAAMRCFVASRLGDEVDIPEELL
jgi:hypothetical protein